MVKEAYRLDVDPIDYIQYIIDHGTDDMKYNDKSSVERMNLYKNGH